MTMHSTVPDSVLERQAYFAGARLARRDLADGRDYEPAIAAVHVHTAHGVWGVAEGLEVALKAGGRHVVVRPGIGFDRAGRVLALDETARLDAPAAPGGGGGREFDLVLVHADAGAGCGGGPGIPDPGGSPAGACPGFAAAMRPAPGRVVWEEARGLHEPGAACRPRSAPDRAVVLARFAVEADGTLRRVRPDRRRAARALARPHMVSGIARPGELTWRRSSYDLRAVVDTRAAGFSDTPVYSVRLTGWPGPRAGFVGPFLSIGHAWSTGFRVHLLFAGRSGSTIDLGTLRDEAGAAAIAWTGVDEHRRCERAPGALLPPGARPGFPWPGGAVLEPGAILDLLRGDA